GSAFDQKVAVAQQRNQHAVDEMGLAHDETARMCFELLEFFYYGHLHSTSQTACHFIDEAVPVQPATSLEESRIVQVNPAFLSPDLRLPAPPGRHRKSADPSMAVLLGNNGFPLRPAGTAYIA